MRILVIGAGGLLGRALIEAANSPDVIPATSHDADIRDADAVRSLFTRTRPDCAVLAAAFTDVDGCERDPERAHSVNCQGAANVARAAREAGSRLLFMSTDYIFDGEKAAPYDTTDPTRPLSAYGRSKAAGEAAVREILPASCIVRTSWLFGTAGKCFPASILRLAETQTELAVVDDQVGSPTFNRDLASAILRLAELGAGGIIHATNSGTCSWFKFAREILRAAGKQNVRVRAISSAESGRPAARPKHSALSNASLQAFGMTLRPWREALRAYLAERERQISQARDESEPQTAAGGPLGRSGVPAGRTR